MPLSKNLSAIGISAAVISVVVGVALEFLQDTWGILGFVSLSVGGASYLLVYRFL